MVVHRVLDMAEFLEDALVSPAFEWPSKIHADEFSQYSGVDSF
jgi:hypothetical protein